MHVRQTNPQKVFPTQAASEEKKTTDWMKENTEKIKKNLPKNVGVNYVIQMYNNAVSCG